MLIGVGATLFMDIWGVVQKRIFGMQTLDYALVGRWVAYLPRGRFRHDPIAASPPIRGEGTIGWITHYLTGIAFAGVLLAIDGTAWSRYPTPGPALAVGIGSVIAPFLIMQPGMGAGIAASRTPRPNVARLRSLVTHGVFGIGLYVAGWAMRGVFE
ncbi:MAG: DUF2938 domain-containing protein [Pseudomonadota bacterium]